MGVPGITAMMAGSTAVSAIMQGARPVWSAGGAGPQPVELVERPAPHASWVSPALVAWAPPAGWVEPEVEWSNVLGLFDFARMGMDQSEQAHPVRYVASDIPLPGTNGIAALPAAGGLTTSELSAAWCRDPLTIEAFGLTPQTGVIVAASSDTVHWSLGWTGSGWSVQVGASSQTVADAPASWPAELALTVDAGVAKLFRDGSLLGTLTGLTMPSNTSRLSIGGEPVSDLWAAHAVRMVRMAC